MERELMLEEKELTTEKEQNDFLQSTIGKAINFAVDLGLRAVLPNFIEDAVIDVKDTLLTEGLAEGIQTIVKNGIDFGKSVIGIFTGKFENVNQMQNAVEKGGIIEATSDLLDSVLSKVQKNNILPKEVTTAIKNGKNILLENVTKNIEDALTEQSKEIENITKYSENWQKYYEAKDFNKMEKEYQKLEKSLEKVVPLENTLKRAREIENIHNLIKNNGKNFEISDIEKQLAQKLA